MTSDPYTITRQPIVYPESDGQPMADNTLQFQWIVTIKENLDALYRDDPDVFVAGDLLWYPVEGHPEIRRAPDAMVVFGRPKGHRGSYRQWEEGHLAPQVVFEVLSPGNTTAEMRDKLAFYTRYDVEEYYLYDPDHIVLKGWLRQGDTLHPIADMQGWTSPRLGIRFLLAPDDLTIYDPQGEPFVTFSEMKFLTEQAKYRATMSQQRATLAEQRATLAEQRADEAHQTLAEMKSVYQQIQTAADEARQRADEAYQRATLAEQQADAERQARQQLEAKLRNLGIDLDTLNEG